MSSGARQGELDQDLAKDALCIGLAVTGLTVDELWAAYARAGGLLTEDELRAAIVGTLYLTHAEHDRIAAAINRHLGSRRAATPVPTADELSTGRTPDGFNGALT